MALKYNWQHPDWPHFVYESEPLSRVIHEYMQIAANLQGQVSQLDQRDKSEAYIYLMVEEAINTSEIEGENLNREEVRSSVARYLDLDLTKPKGLFHKENGIASLLVDVRSKFTCNLSKKIICDWHALLFNGQEEYYAKQAVNLGEYRNGPVAIVSGRGDYEEVVFEGPPGHAVEGEMAAFIEWYNATSPLNVTENAVYIAGPIRSAIAHMWFTSIHPFGDGNGRIARAISEHALFQDFQIPPLLSISTTINEHRDSYYKKLAEISRVTPSVDLREWVKWFAEITKHSQINAKQKIDFILKKSIFWDHHRTTDLNPRQHKVVSKCFEFGEHGLIKNGIHSERYQTMTGCSSATATRDLRDMVNKGILEPSSSGGRSMRYYLKLIDAKPVFNVLPRAHDEEMRQMSLSKIADDIQRNIDFFQAPNARLTKLISKYKEIANGNETYLKRLKDILAQLD